MRGCDMRKRASPWMGALSPLLSSVLSASFCVRASHIIPLHTQHARRRGAARLPRGAGACGATGACFTHAPVRCLPALCALHRVPHCRGRGARPGRGA
jgi:hypothetical protein